MRRIPTNLCAAASIATFLATPSRAFAPSSVAGPKRLGVVDRIHLPRGPIVSRNLFFNSERSVDASEENEANDDPSRADDFFSSFVRNVMQQNGFNVASAAPPAVPIETEEQKQKRLRLERLARVEAGEARRQKRVAEDKFGYLFLFALQLLPLVGSDRVESILYFFGVAVTTVYLGGRQEVIDEPERVSRQNALYAPIGASVAIGGLYLLLKVGIDPTALYAIAVTIFGALAISDIGVPILRNVLPENFANAEVPIPKPLAEKLDLDKDSLPLDGLVTLGLGVLCTLVYWAPAAMEQKFLVSNGESIMLAMFRISFFVLIR